MTKQQHTATIPTAILSAAEGSGIKDSRMPLPYGQDGMSVDAGPPTVGLGGRDLVLAELQVLARHQVEEGNQALRRMRVEAHHLWRQVRQCRQRVRLQVGILPSTRRMWMRVRYS